MNNQMTTVGEAISAAKPAFDRIAELYKKKGGAPVEYAREAAFAMQICEGNKALAKREMLPSLMNAVQNVALCGISLNPALKLAYLVPRKGMACLDISYMGLIKIATDSGSVTKVNCQLVYEKDFFEIEHGTHERLVHKPDVFGNRGELKGVYVIATLHNGSSLIETMSKAETDAIKQRSKAFTNGNSSPWHTDESEMIRKTCVKRASKYWPKTEQLAQAINTLDKHEGYVDAIGEEKQPDGASVNHEAEVDDVVSLRKQVMATLKAEAETAGVAVRDYAFEEYGIKTVAGMNAEECKSFLEGYEAPPAEGGES